MGVIKYIGRFKCIASTNIFGVGAKKKILAGGNHSLPIIVTPSPYSYFK